MSKINQTCKCDGFQSGCSDIGCPSQNKIETTRFIPPLNYDIVEMNLKHLQGQILTLIEATITDLRQQKATKDIIKDHFNQKLTHLFDSYGHTTQIGRETPDYSYPNE